MTTCTEDTILTTEQKQIKMIADQYIGYRLMNLEGGTHDEVVNFMGDNEDEVYGFHPSLDILIRGIETGKAFVNALLG